MKRELQKTFIVDDEPNAAHLLQRLLNAFPIFGNILVYTNATEAFTAIIEQQPDFLFLDIQMPEISGLQLAEKVRAHAPHTKIIYVTAYEKYALEALRQNAYDYLLKPVEKAELIRLADKLLQHKENQENQKTEKTILIRGIEGMYQLKTDEIVFLEADSSYSTFVLSSGKKIVATLHMGKILHSLPEDQFIRISRKHLVNRSFITFYHSRDKFLKLETPNKEYKLEVTLKVHEIKELLSSI